MLVICLSKLGNSKLHVHRHADASATAQLWHTYLCNDSTQAALKLANDTTEDGKVVCKLSSIHIHGIIVQLLKLLSSCLEVSGDLLDTVGQCLALHTPLAML